MSRIGPYYSGLPVLQDGNITNGIYSGIFSLDKMSGFVRQGDKPKGNAYIRNDNPQVVNAMNMAG